MTTPMTPDEKREWLYLYTERLGILAADAEPTEAQKEIARVQADQWLRESRGELF